MHVADSTECHPRVSHCRFRVDSICTLGTCGIAGGVQLVCVLSERDVRVVVVKLAVVLCSPHC